MAARSYVVVLDDHRPGARRRGIPPRDNTAVGLAEYDSDRVAATPADRAPVDRAPVDRTSAGHTLAGLSSGGSADRASVGLAPAKPSAPDLDMPDLDTSGLDMPGLDVLGVDALGFGGVELGGAESRSGLDASGFRASGRARRVGRHADRRLLAVWCRDWSVVAAGAVLGFPVVDAVAVLAANRIVACSTAARAEGIRRGMRRRDAQSRCPELTIVEHDPDRDARLFEPVAAAVEELAPGVEVIRPGLVAAVARGPVGYFGGAEAAAERIVDHVAALAGVECQVGIADGLFAATLAAHRARIVAPGEAGAFLAPLGINELAGSADGPDRVELVDLLRRLGIKTLGAFAAVPERDVSSRFGGAAVAAHRLASGRAERPVDRRRPPPDLTVTTELDPPADRVDAAAFAARTAATRLYANLVAHGLACTRLSILIRTEAGEERERVWRCAEPLDLKGITDRVRWQLDGWLRGGHHNPGHHNPGHHNPDHDDPGHHDPGHRTRDQNGNTAHPSGRITWERPTSAITELRLAPAEVVDGRTLQSGLWSDTETASDEASERAGRALVHVQGLLGPEGVYTAVLGGGRGPGERVRLIPWGDERVPAADPAAPWPGRLPEPSPALLPTDPMPVAVLDDRGAEIGVTGDHLLTGTPHRAAIGGGTPREVLGWAGPWPVVERWWEPDDSRRAARLQVVVADRDSGRSAFLLLREGGRWRVEGKYD
jgi:protein ImuB